MLQIERIFHPIGQGGFFTERLAYTNSLSEISHINIVYDCGVSRNRKSLETEINRHFRDKSEIDLMFISHLDMDHINGLKIIKEKGIKIKCLVLPLLSNEFFWFYFLESGLNLYKGDTLNTFFNADMILYINPVNNDPLNPNNNSLNLNHNSQRQHHSPIVNNNNFPGKSVQLPGVINNQVDISEFITSKGAGTIVSYYTNSNIRFYFKDAPEWCYIPYNYDFKNRYNDLMNSLKTKDVKLYYEIDKGQIDESLILNTDKLNILRTCYNEIKGKRNDSSLVVYSGPISSKNSFKMKTLRYDNTYVKKDFVRTSGHVIKKTVGAIYTGDISLNQTVDGCNILEDLVKNLNGNEQLVGTFQIPHHGAIKNYNPLVFHKFGKAIYFFVSYGTYNTYGHPYSSLRFDVMNNNKILMDVTEQSLSGIKQFIQ